MVKKPALGKGIEALFADSAGSADSSAVSTLRISFIQPRKNQPRRHFDKEALSELADSISRLGVLSPIVVRSAENGYYQIIAGERRWRAAKMAGVDEVPVIIRDVDDITAAELTMVENLQREDLNPVEEAQGYKYLMDNFNLTQDEVARRVSKSRPAVANALRLLALPGEILAYLEEGVISSGHARALLAFDDAEEQLEIAERIIKLGLSVRDVEKLSQRGRKMVVSGDPLSGEREMYIRRLQKNMAEKLGTKVDISATGKSGGRLEIAYRDNDQLEYLIRMLCGDDIFEE